MFVVAVAESCAGHRVTGVQQVVQCGVEVVGGDLQTVVLGLLFSVGGYDRCAAKQLTTRARVQALTRSDSQTRQRGLLNVPDVDGRQVDHYCLLGIRRSGSAMAVTRNGRHIR